MLYIFIAGQPPWQANKSFSLEQKAELMEDIKSGKEMADASAEVRDLVSKLLVIDPAGRLTVEEALNHPWLLAMDSSLVEEEKRDLGEEVEENFEAQAQLGF